MSEKKITRFVAGEYTPELLNMIGESTLRDFIKESDQAISDSQMFNAEVRTKGLHTVGFFMSIIIALFVAIYTIENLAVPAKNYIILLILIFSYYMYKIFKGTVYEKTNYSGGNTIKYLLTQNIIDKLSSLTDEEGRTNMHLFYMLERKEETCNNIDEETGRMQKCYKDAISQMMLILIISFICFLLFATPVLSQNLATNLKGEFLDSLNQFLSCLN